MSFGVCYLLIGGKAENPQGKGVYSMQKIMHCGNKQMQSTAVYEFRNGNFALCGATFYKL